MTVYIKSKNGKMHIYESVKSIETYFEFITLTFQDDTETSLFRFDNDIVDILD